MVNIAVGRTNACLPAKHRVGLASWQRLRASAPCVTSVNSIRHTHRGVDMQPYAKRQMNKSRGVRV